MCSDPFRDERIVDSWRRNAAPWTAAVREKKIESRALVTNAAVIAAIRGRHPESALDIGCGEGWLVRELAATGVRATGVDVVPALIEQARLAGGGEFQVASYEAIARDELDLTADVVVANFSLLGKESVDGLFRAIPRLLNDGGAFIVQTLHPVAACGELPYVDGWREGSWAGCGSGFTDPAPWYFRTMASWMNLFTSSGFQIVEMREPLHPVTRQPASVIFIAESSPPFTDLTS